MKNFITQGLYVVWLWNALGYVHAQQQYAISGIPPTLLENADVVVREAAEEFIITAPNKATHKERVAYTILNERGRAYSQLELYYDKFRKVDNLEATLYNAAGAEVRRLKKSEVRDFSNIADYSVYSDNRVKTAELRDAQYPYTVVFESEIDYNGLFYYPRWYPQAAPNISVVKASMKVTSPTEIAVRHMSVAGAPKPRTSTADNKTTYYWEMKNITAFRPEPRSRTEVPVVYLAPTTFECGGYPGKMQSWQDLGKWYNDLCADRTEIAPETQAKIKQMTANLPTTEAKVKKVYEFLQNKTRYVSIDLGIGGWQPFPAKLVDEKSYGDCKALSNYTVSLLSSIGIKAHQVLVRAGSDNYPIETKFPATQFNHAIVCVPQPRDTIWLECTSQSEAFGYIGGFTDDRDVLVVTPEGGKIAHTTIYTHKDNLQARTARIKIEPSGDATATITTRYRALQEGSRKYLIEQSPEEQKKWLEENTDLQNFTLKSFKLRRQKDRIPTTTEELQAQIRKAASVSGKRLFLIPNLMNQSDETYESAPNRVNEVWLRMGYIDTDTLVFDLPEKFSIEYQPEAVKLSTTFGNYSAEYQLSEGKLTYIRRIEIRKGRYPKTAYNELVEFWQKVYKADRAKVVLVNKT